MNDGDQIDRRFQPTWEGKRTGGCDTPVNQPVEINPNALRFITSDYLRRFGEALHRWDDINRNGMSA